MSTKIFDAFVYENASDLGTADVFGLMSAIRSAAETVRVDLDASFLVNQAVCLIDEADFQNIQRVDEPIVQANENWKMSKMSEHPNTVFRDPHFFECSIGYDAEYDNLMLKGHFHERAYAEELHKLGLKDFSYWNHTDKPDEVTQGQWNHRRDRWNTMLGGNGLTPPAETMLSMKVYSGYSAQMLISQLLDYNESSGAHSKVVEHLENAHTQTGVFLRAKNVADFLLNRKIHEVLMSRKSEEGFDFLDQYLSLKMSDMYFNAKEDLTTMIAPLVNTVSIGELWARSESNDVVIEPIDVSAVNAYVENIVFSR